MGTAPSIISPRRRPVVAAAFLVLGILAAYHNSFSGPFVFDDSKSIVENPTLRHLWPIGGPLSPPTDLGVAGRPVLNLSLAVNYALGGLNVWGYHALNLLIHILAALALFGVVRRTLERTGARPALDPDLTALLVALLWAVHPLQTASVTYVIQRAESLMGLFFLLTLYCFIRFAEAGRVVWAWLSVTFCLLGMATKEVMAAAPLIVLLYDRTFVAGTFRGTWRKHWPVHLALAGTWIFLGILMAGLPKRGIGFGYGVSAWTYGLTECGVIVRYLGLAVWPHPLVLDHDTRIVTDAAAAAPWAAVLLALLAATVFALWRRPVLGFIGCWFFVILAPTSSFIPVALQPMAENRMYLPLAAVVLLAVWGLSALSGRAVWAVGLALAAGLGWLTVERNRDYRTEAGIWTDTVAKSPDNPRAEYNLATVLLKEGKAADAVSHFERSLRLEADDPEVAYNLGLALADTGRLDESIARYEEALRLKPDFAKAHNNLGIVLAGSGRREEALPHFAEAVRINPGFAEAQNNWGNALYGLGRAEEARAHLEEAVRLQPESAGFRKRLAMALAQSGHLEEAISQFEEVLRLQPADAATHYNLGLLLRSAGRTAEAQAQFDEAARLKAAR